MTGHGVPSSSPAPPPSSGSERRGIQIGEKPTPTRRTYVSRKTGTPGSVPPLPHPPTSIDDEKKKILEASQSAVTIGFVTPDKTQYESGFIVASDDNYCLVFSLSTFMAEQYIVYLEEKRAKHDAYALYKTSTHLILIVLTDKKYTPITFDHEQLEHDIVFTVGTMTGTKLHANSRAPMRELESVLGFYKGKVTVVSCGASDCANKDVRGTEKYFQLTCDVHDDIITLENVDETDHTADIVVSAPIFRSNGKSIGIISSDDVWGDTKIGMHVNSIISLIKAKVKMKKEEVWEAMTRPSWLLGGWGPESRVRLALVDCFVAYALAPKPSRKPSLRSVGGRHGWRRFLPAQTSGGDASDGRGGLGRVSRLVILPNPRSPDPSLNRGFISSGTSCAMTAKTLRNKGQIDCTRGVSREQRAISRRNKLESSLLSNQEIRKAVANYYNNLCAIEEERFGKDLRDREVLSISFEEKSFGHVVKPGQQTYRISANVDVDLSSIVVSLALFDGDKMLFACSGIPPNKICDIGCFVRLPNNTITDGFLGLYDHDIAIVTCLGLLEVHPISFKACPDGSQALAAGRAFESGNLMAMDGSVRCNNTWVPGSQGISKAVLGGPLIGKDKGFLGMNFSICHDDDGTSTYAFLPTKLLRKRLEHFGVLKLLGSLSPKHLHFRGYSLPKGVSSTIPSGFMKTIYRLKSYGYPMPPPLVLELNGELLNHFEERFGELLAWKGYPYGDLAKSCRNRVWYQLPKEVVTDISRRVVSVASFNGFVRFFACTGLIIKWHGSKATHTVILTSASLVSRCNDDKIDSNLTIEVFLPLNQRSCGTLEFYNLNYNIAIVSLKKNLSAVRPEDIFSKTVQEPSEKVVAIGRDTRLGPLMATIGNVKHGKKGCKLDCKDLKLSTCKIKKAGIGGPLINFDGSFVGMNFYDGSEATPFLPRHKIVEVLSRVNDLPSESGCNNPMPIDVSEGTKKTRWPVPEPYWYHGSLDVDRSYVPKCIGRHLQ
uniref:Uncharacterized protein n=1 Tax=Oryza punctata TaxID=4537 RepID=A0A0E0M8N6_ORYPU